MTENEKLRALLAEARKIVHTILDIDALHGWACESDGDEPALDDLLRDLRSRIDAALAEPVSVHPSSLTDVVTLLENERDEARAEVERLKARYEMLGRLAYADVEVAEAKAREAYQRGAEAMREAAALVVDGDSVVLRSYRSVQAGRIRALPVPEDKR